MKSALGPLLAQGLFTLVLVGLALLVYDGLAVAPPPPRIGVVDLQAVYREKEAEFSRRVTQANSEAEREQAMQAARAFARQLPAALESLPTECGCMVLLSSAVLAPAPRAIDLTSMLQRKLDPDGTQPSATRPYTRRSADRQ